MKKKDKPLPLADVKTPEQITQEEWDALKAEDRVRPLIKKWGLEIYHPDHPDNPLLPRKEREKKA